MSKKEEDEERKKKMEQEKKDRILAEKLSKEKNKDDPKKTPVS